jgi:L-ascorbate metabolism protein UlaG (beta-lactamase superfamily)
MKRRQLLPGLGKTLGLAALPTLLAACATAGSSDNPYYRGPVSDHFDGRTFFNPDGASPKGLGDFLRWKLGGDRAEWPAHYPSPHPAAVPAERLPPEALRLTMVGHATLLIQTGGLNILTDPVWSERASPWSFIGPKRVNAPGIAFERLPPIDVVLVTHNHYDHLDVATLALLQQAHDPLVLTPLGNDTIIEKAVPAMRVEARDWDQSLGHGALTFHLEPCHHWSARGLGDRRMALWAAFVIEGPAGRLYHVGDTGFDDGRNYRSAEARHGQFRAAILPVGAYEPRWFMAPQHQNPEEAVAGLLDCGAAHAAGIHWGTFQLTDEPIEAPLRALEAARAAQGLPPERFRPLRPGEVWDVPAVT